MPKLFGVDIAGLIAAGMGPGLLAVTLVRVAHGSYGTTLSAGRDKTEVSYPCRGFLETYDARQVDGTLVLADDRKVSILGGTLPTGIVPRPADRVTIEGATYHVVRVGRDPAGAVYACQARG